MQLIHPSLETNAGKILRYLTEHPFAYGLQIGRACQIKQTGLYTTLARMEKEQLVESRWGESKLGARRKHYNLRRRPQ